MKSFYTILILLIPFVGFGQGWEKTFGGIEEDYGQHVKQTTDGGYIITGLTESFGNGVRDVYLIKTDENGNEQWTKTFGGTDIDRGYSVQQTNDGGYVITGYTYSFDLSNGDVYLIKTDENGNEQWTKTFGGIEEDYGRHVKQTTAGGYIITGYTRSFGNGQNDVYLIKTDENGDEEWSQILGGTYVDLGFSVQQTTDDGYIITGYTESFGNGEQDIHLIKTDVSGNEQWTKTFGGTGYDTGESVQQTTDGGYIITGVTNSFGDPLGDIYLIKTDDNGNEQWSQTYGGIEVDMGSYVKQTNDNGYIILGNTESFGSGKLDFYLVKTDENGNYEWSQTYGGNEDDWGYSLDITSDGGFILCGVTESFGNNIQGDIFLIKTDDQGNITSTFEIPLPKPNRKLEKTINLKGQEIKHQTGQPVVKIYDDGTVEKKLIIE